MLFVLVGFMLLASIALLCLKRNRESLYLLGMCVSLTLQLTGILIFIAKKGGYTQDILRFLFFSMPVKTKVQYLLITLNDLGYLIALGRYLYPLFLMEMALHFSLARFVRRHSSIRKWVALLPALSLTLYYPAVFRWLTGRWPWLQGALASLSYDWVVAYVAVAIALLVYELAMTRARFCRREFAFIVVYMVSMSGLYLLYCGQDPAQVYRFYSVSSGISKGLGYLQYAPTIGGFIALAVLNVICCVLGVISFTRYTREVWLTDRENMVMERKFDVARTGASVFVHSIKNQLLANRVLEKHAMQELSKPAPDLETLRGLIERMQESNELLLSRSEELYRAVKNQSVRLTPTPLSRITRDAVQRALRKHPEARIRNEAQENTRVLADETYLSEALCNLLNNAWEANLMAEHSDRDVVLSFHSGRRYVALEVRDEGIGISRNEQRRIFEPFYSSKNSNTSWGMGLYHTRSIVRAHLGSLRVESQPGQGASFLVLLPRYERERRRLHGDSPANRG